MNSFLVMMAASGAANKKEAIQIKPVVINQKVGRPPAAKQAAPVIDPFPIVDLTNVTASAVSRRNYDTGDSKTKMDNALIQDKKKID